MVVGVGLGIQCYSCQIQDDFLEEMVFSFSIHYSYYDMPSFAYFIKGTFLYFVSMLEFLIHIGCYGEWGDGKTHFLKKAMTDQMFHCSVVHD